jgi:hypothetical protein
MLIWSNLSLTHLSSFSNAVYRCQGIWGILELSFPRISFLAQTFYLNKIFRRLIFYSRTVFDAGIVVMFYFLNFADGVGNLAYFFGCVTAC